MSGFEVVFGVVTGGAGLVSLGLQLGDCARKLNKIYHLGKDAPKSLQRLSFDLETMALCLQMLEQHRQHHRQNPATGILIRCITACQQATNDIQQVVDKMTRRMEDQARLRGRLYFVFKEQDVQQLLTELERAKSSIEFAYMMYQAEAQRQRDEAHSTQLELHGRSLNGLQPRITDASLEIVRQAAPYNFPLTSSAATVEAELGKTQVRRKGKRALPTYRVRFRVPQHFCRRIWDAAITISQCSLNFDLKTYNLVPEKSPIFHFCETGDLGTVQKLVQAGEAGLLDIREPVRRRKGKHGFQTLLECAAQCGYLHICQYLLDVVVWPDQAAILSSALSLYSTNVMCSDELEHNGTPVLRPPLYRLFIEDPDFPAFDMSVDEILENGSAIHWLAHCRYLRDLDEILKTFPPQVWSSPICTRFEVAMQLGIWSTTAGFLKCLGDGASSLQASDPRLPSLRTKYSKRSVLHYVGCRLSDVCLMSPWEAGVKEWVDLGVSVIQNGADPSSIATHHPRVVFDQPPQTPETPLLACLMLFIQSDGTDCSDVKWWRYTTLKLIRTWAGMMQQAGMDLSKYGAKESETWRSIGKSSPSSLFKEWSLLELLYGPTPEQWSLKMQSRHAVELKVFVRDQPPGWFPREQDALPNKILWEPNLKEREEGPWISAKPVRMPFQPRSLEEWISNLEEAEEPFITLANAIQDDNGALCRIQHRASRTRTHHSRSHSQPPPQRTGPGPGRFNAHNVWPTRPWCPEFHRCPSNFHWGFHQAQVNLRDCVEGAALGPPSLQESSHWKDYSFLAEISRCQARNKDNIVMDRFGGRRHTGTKDCPWNCRAVRLQDLPVPEELKAYHPAFEVPYQKYLEE